MIEKSNRFRIHPIPSKNVKHKQSEKSEKKRFFPFELVAKENNKKHKRSLFTFWVDEEHSQYVKTVHGFK